SGKTGKPFVDAPLPGFETLRGTAVNMGNPHLVFRDVPLKEAGTLGPKLEHHRDFPQRTNVEFTRREGSGLEIVVWERGVGLTQACGTGACAAAAAWVKAGLLPAGEWIPVRLPGGVLQIRVAADLGQVHLRGPARFVFEGVVPPARGL
ncbi:MAG: diaminopimelate epimerase, partial [Myxococcaceae bacterium]